MRNGLALRRLQSIAVAAAALVALGRGRADEPAPLTKPPRLVRFIEAEAPPRLAELGRVDVILTIDIDAAGSRQVTRSRATRPRTFARIMQTMNIRPEDYVFVDFGSGKGRILMLASELPFKKVIGVELSAKLHEVAKQNVALFRAKSGKGHAIELVCMDAASYPLPVANTVFYFFDPFPLEVMSAVIENIGQSLLRYPRRVFLAYVNPTYCAAMDRSGFLTRICSVTGGSPETHPEYPWLVYTNTTSGSFA